MSQTDLLVRALIFMLFLPTMLAGAIVTQEFMRGNNIWGAAITFSLTCASLAYALFVVLG